MASVVPPTCCPTNATSFLFKYFPLHLLMVFKGRNQNSVNGPLGSGGESICVEVDGSAVSLSLNYDFEYAIRTLGATRREDGRN